MKFGNSGRYIHNQAHAIWLGCVRICHFYRTLSRVKFFRGHSVNPYNGVGVCGWV